MDNPDSPLEICTTDEPDRCVIWLHGLGADGHDFESIVPELNLPAALGVRFVFPHAPKRPVTINGGMVMRAWYDISPIAGGFADDDEDVRRSVDIVKTLVAQQAGYGIRPGHIVIAGFSQGGAIGLAAGLSMDQPVAGIMALSTYLPMADTFPRWMNPATLSVPVFQAHGLMDPLIPVARGRHTHALLHSQGYGAAWHEYPMAHAVCAQELDDISSWLVKVLGADA